MKAHISVDIEGVTAIAGGNRRLLMLNFAT